MDTKTSLDTSKDKAQFFTVAFIVCEAVNILFHTTEFPSWLWQTYNMIHLGSLIGDSAYQQMYLFFHDMAAWLLLLCIPILFIGMLLYGIRYALLLWKTPRPSKHSNGN